MPSHKKGVPVAVRGADMLDYAPTTGRPGDMFFVTDGRKTGEGAGSGTGVMCYWDGSGDWKTVDDSSTVAN